MQIDVGGYQVCIRGEEITIEASAPTGVTPIVRSICPSAGPEIIPALTGKVVRWWKQEDDRVVVEFAGKWGENGEHRIVTQLTVSENEPMIRLDACDYISGSAEVSRFSVGWEFLSGPTGSAPPDFVWTPGLCPEPGQVVGRHMFRSPAAIVQHDTVAVALIPDLESMETGGALQEFLEVECNRTGIDSALLTYGLATYRLDGHVYYTTADEPARIVEDTVIRFSCELHIDAMASPQRGFQTVVRHHWRKYGHPAVQDVKPQVVPYQRYYEYGYDYADSHLWRETEKDGIRLGAMTASHEYTNDVWFHGWFNQLRSAYGLYSWAKRAGDDERMSRAAATRDLILSAPTNKGIFPTIAILPEESHGAVRWVESSLQGGGPGVYHLLDSSWTAWWLLRWHKDLTPDERIIDFCTEYAEGLLRLQNPDGGWPDYIDAETGECVTSYDLPSAQHMSNSKYVKGIYKRWGTERLPTSAESAAEVLFLAELSRTVPDGEQYLERALQGARFLERTVIPEHKWFDWETYFSCSPKPLDFYDSRSCQHPQNTMSLYWAAEAFRVLYEIVGTASIGEQALTLLDYLCLYQQVWSPPFLSIYGFGGFGVMNTDGEWNDARQAVFADGLALMYLESGRREYLERAIAATRAAFACTFIPENAGVCPKIFDRTPTGYADENYAHGGWDAPAGASGFDWGTGSAITAAARLTDLFGDIWIDTEGGWAVGTDGITVTGCEQEGDRLYLTVTSPFRDVDGPLDVRGNFDDTESFSVYVNGRPTSVTTET